MMQPWLQPLLGSVSAVAITAGPVPGPSALSVPSDVLGSHIYVYDETDDVPLFARAEETAVSTASLIKIVTAMVAADEFSGSLDSETLTYSAADDDTPGFFSYDDHQDGDEMTLRGALTAMLMASGNNTAKMISRHVGSAMLGGSPTVTEARAEFVSAMQAKALSAGIPDLTINDEAGDATGTAVSVRHIIREMQTYPDLTAAAANATYPLIITGANARTDTVEHTFPLFQTPGFGPSKTGYATDHRNVATVWEAANGNKVSIVVLKSDEGDPENDPNTRFQDVVRLLLHIKDLFPLAGYGTTLSAGDTDPGARQRWRLLVHSPGNNQLFLGAAELLFHVEGTLGPVIQSGTPVASDERAGFEAANLFDGSNTSYWSPPAAPSYPASVELDFGSASTVRAVRLQARNDFPGQCFGSFDVQYHDGANWTTAWSVRGADDFSTSEDRVYLAPYALDPAIGVHRYWRTRALSGGNASNFWSVAEIEFRAVPAGADLTGSGSAISSSDRSGFEASRAFDNAAGTCWSPVQDPPTPLFIGYDFGVGETEEVLEVTITARNDGFHTQNMRRFALEYSDDGTSWVESFRVISPQAAYSSGETRVFSAPEPYVPA